MRRWLLPFLFLPSLAGCAGHSVYATAPEIQRADTLPPPTNADLFEHQRPYLIGPLDKLDIKVFGVDDLSLKVQADASGRISMPLAGVIDASGKSPEEVATQIAKSLSARYIRNPQVSVNLEETVSQVVTVDGQVNAPGMYPVVGNMTLLKSIAAAKGTTEYARMQDVVVFRTVSGQKMAGIYNLKAIRQGNYADPSVYPGDVVVVDDSQARRFFRDALLAAPAVLTPLVYILSR